MIEIAQFKKFLLSSPRKKSVCLCVCMCGGGGGGGGGGVGRKCRLCSASYTAAKSMVDWRRNGKRLLFCLDSCIWH